MGLIGANVLFVRLKEKNHRVNLAVRILDNFIGCPSVKPVSADIKEKGNA